MATVAHQFDALVSLCFNIGSKSFRTSTVLRKHRSGNYAGAADAFLMWDKDHRDGKLVVAAGLLKRRRLERGFYLTGVLPVSGAKPLPWPRKRKAKRKRN